MPDPHTTKPICLVHITDSGLPFYYFCGEVDFVIVDETAPNDRVYVMTQETARVKMENLIGDGEIGSCNDKRHAAIVHRIEKAKEGKSHLEVIDEQT